MQVLLLAIVAVTVVAASALPYHVFVNVSEDQEVVEQDVSFTVLKLNNENENLIQGLGKKMTISPGRSMFTRLMVDQATLQKATSLEFKWTSDKPNAKPIKVDKIEFQSFAVWSYKAFCYNEAIANEKSVTFTAC